jgi:hypothetical protein
LLKWESFWRFSHWVVKVSSDILEWCTASIWWLSLVNVDAAVTGCKECFCLYRAFCNILWAQWLHCIANLHMPVCPVTATVPSVSCYSYSARYSNKKRTQFINRHIIPSYCMINLNHVLSHWRQRLEQTTTWCKNTKINLYHMWLQESGCGLSSAASIHVTPSYPISVRSIWITFSHPGPLRDLFFP